MLTAEQAAQCVEAGIPVVPHTYNMAGYVLPIVKGTQFLRIVKFEQTRSPVMVFIYTDTEMSVEDATDMAIDWVNQLSVAAISAREEEPVLVI